MSDNIQPSQSPPDRAVRVIGEDCKILDRIRRDWGGLPTSRIISVMIRSFDRMPPVQQAAAIRGQVPEPASA